MTLIYQDKRTGLLLPDNVRSQTKGYSEAGTSLTQRAMKGFIPRSGSPNEDINWNNYTLRQRGGMLYMSVPLTTSAINTNGTKVIGVGLSLQAAVATVGSLRGYVETHPRKSKPPQGPGNGHPDQNDKKAPSERC